MNKRRIPFIIALSFIILFSTTAYGEDRVILDMAGRKVYLPNTIKRIVTKYHSATDFIFALQAQYALVIELDIHRIGTYNALLPEHYRTASCRLPRKMGCSIVHYGKSSLNPTDII